MPQARASEAEQPPRETAPDDESAGGHMSRLYKELCAIAASTMKGERTGHTLQPTALVHEAYLRLAELENMDFNDELHFRAVAAEMMRRVLVDHARRRGAAKRGADWRRITLTGLEERDRETVFDLLEFDAALDALDALSTRQRQVVELRFFGGLTNEQVGALLGIAEPTVRLDWSMARAWLKRYLESRNS